MKFIRHIFFPVFVLFFTSNLTMGQGSDIPEIFKVKLKYYVEKLPTHRAYIRLDRSTYNPGDDIWFKVLIADYFNGSPVDETQQVKVNLVGSGNMALISLPFQIAGGQCEGHVPLPKSMTAGNYRVTVTGKGLSSAPDYFREVVVKEAAVPAFIINAELPNKTYMPGDNIEGHLKFTDYYNEPLKNVEYEVVFSDGKRDVTVVTDKSDKMGTGTFKYKIPSKLPNGSLILKVTANRKGEFELLEGLVPVTSEAVYLRMWPEGNQLLANVKNNMAFQCVDAVGSPYEFEGQVLDGNGQIVANVKSDDKGLGHFTLKPNRNSKYSLRIVRPYLLDKTFDLPEVSNVGTVLRLVSQSPGEVKLLIRSPNREGNTVYLLGREGQNIFWSRAITVQDSMVIGVPISGAHSRVLNFSLFNLSYVPISELSVVTEPTDQPSLKVSIDKMEYAPRDKVTVSVSMPGIDPEMLSNISLSAVNHTWNAGQDQSDFGRSWNFPVDFSDDVLFNKAWKNADLTPEDKQDLMVFYHPSGIDWSAVMGVQSPGVPAKPDEAVAGNIALKERILSTNSMVTNDRQIDYVNTTADSYFLTSNPDYIDFLNTKVIKRKEPYKILLENGESLREVINAIKPYSLENNKIVFMGSRNSLLFQDGALIVVDGSQLGTDASVLDNISPYTVDKIFVSTNPNDIQRYTGLNSVGLIEITTKRGPEILEDEVIKGYDAKAQFDAPDYSKGSPDLRNKDDYRATLDWEPNVHMQGNQATVTFYNSDLRDVVDIVVEAIDKKGNVVSATSTYKVGGLNN